MIVLYIKGKNNFKNFYYIHIVEITGRALMKMFRVVPQTKEGIMTFSTI